MTTRNRFLALVLAAFAAASAPRAPLSSRAVAAPAAVAPAESPALRIAAVASISLTVSDLDCSVAFFADVLSFEKAGDAEIWGDAAESLYGVFGMRARVATMRLGEETIELIQFLAPEGRPIPRDWASNDHSFQHIAIVVSDMDAAYAHLRKHNVRHASTGPQILPEWNHAAAGISAFYFKDHDGHVLEVIHFPEGKGNPRWRSAAASGRLFLGIDHTAIVVDDTERSLAFYRDALGMRVAGASENYGPEQERLNNVFGARLRITTLRAERGPGVELLEYLAPANGRPAPADTCANDLWAWRTRVTAAAPVADEWIQQVRRGAGRLISPGVVPAASALHVLDPDGHAVIVSLPQ